MAPILSILKGVKEIAKTLPSEFKGVVHAADEHIEEEEARRVEYTRP